MPSTSDPLRVTAHLRGPINLPAGALALDALLCAAVVIRDRVPPIEPGVPFAKLAIPIEREPGGRFYLASFSIGCVEAVERDWTNRRFPIPEAQAIGRTITSVRISGGPAKSYRLPRERQHMEGDRLDWYCIGDRLAVCALLSYVTYLGKRRAVGLGAVARWEVVPCEPWQGFPVVRDGRPLRPLPPDWPGLIEPEMAMVVMDEPYWLRVGPDGESRETICAVPPW